MVSGRPSGEVVVYEGGDVMAGWLDPAGAVMWFLEGRRDAARWAVDLLRSAAGAGAVFGLRCGRGRADWSRRGRRGSGGWLYRRGA